LIAAKRADAIAAEQALHHLTISQESAEMLRRIIKEGQDHKKMLDNQAKMMEVLLKKEGNDG
jgi:hypothetical protein